VKPILYSSSAEAGPTLEAAHFTRAQNGKGLAWKVIPSLQAVTAFPQGQPATSSADNVRLDYDVSLAAGGDTTLALYLVPTLDTDGHDGIRIGVSVDDSPVQTLTSQLVPTAGDSKSQAQKNWVKAVTDNVEVLRTRFPGLKPGKHTFRIWRLDDNAVLQKLVLDKPSS
jgi:hypothetical protein